MRTTRNIDNTDPSGAPCARARTTSAELMGGARELTIVHAGEEYRLRITRNDKLILTK